MNTTTYTIAEAGAKTLKDMKLMTFGLNRYVTVQVTGSHVALFVGLVLHYEGELPEGISERTDEFYAWARQTATEGEAAMEALLEAETTAQLTKNSAGLTLAGVSDYEYSNMKAGRLSDAKKFWDRFNALPLKQMAAYGAYRKFQLEQDRWWRMANA